MALINCPECGHQVSTAASACPSCGAKPPSPTVAGTSWPAVLFLSLMALVLIGAAVTSGGQGRSTSGSGGTLSAGQQVARELLQKRPECISAVKNLERLGVGIRRSSGITVALYNPVIWSQLDHDDKVRQALLFFCSDQPENGRHTVLIRDVKSNKVIGSVVDGQYLD